MFSRKLCYGLLLSVFLCGIGAGLPGSAATLENDAVRDGADGDVVRSHDGNCVRSHWNNQENDPCAPAKKPEPVVMAPPPVVVAAPPPPPPVMVRRPVVQTLISEEKRTVYFASNQATLSASAQAKLDSLVPVLQNAHDIQRVNIVGFADKMGKSKANLLLSQRRARAVEAYLHGRHYMNTKVVDLRGVGSSEANAPCGKVKKRSRKIICNSPDRKVTLEIVYTHQVVRQ